MWEVILKEVTHMKFPDTEDGVSGFYGDKGENNCIDPHKPYDISGKNNFCHTIGDELDILAIMVGFKTRNQFKEEHFSRNWRDSYAEALTKHIKPIIEKEGIDWVINGEHIHFYCPEDKFIPWRKVKNKIKN